MTASINRCHRSLSSRDVARRVCRKLLNSGFAGPPSKPEQRTARTGKDSKNGHVLRLVAGHTHFYTAKATPTPKTTAKSTDREDAGRRPGRGCGRSPRTVQEDTRRRRGRGAAARAGRLFSSGSLRSRPQAQSRQARALRAKNLLC